MRSFRVESGGIKLITIILIIENYRKLREVIKGLLKKHMTNLEIIEADSGKEGIAKVMQKKPAIVLLDMILPDMDGIAVAKRIKKEAPGCKIIFLTTVVDKNITRTYKPSGVKAIIGKNEIFEKLIPTIKKYSKEGKI